MPRRARITAAGVAHHVVHRGVNRQPAFFNAEDYQTYLECLSEGAHRYGCAIHAYVLMINHVHLLVTPGEKEALGTMMRYVGSRYVQHVNHAYQRHGTLWEGRFRSNLVHAGYYVLECYRHIESNPMRAGLVTQPEHYRWSSYACHALCKTDKLISDHETYRKLGATPEARCAAYGTLFSRETNPEVSEVIRVALSRGLPLGEEGDKDPLRLVFSRSARLSLHRRERGGEERKF